jgi:hypothetical protein
MMALTSSIMEILEGMVPAMELATNGLNAQKVALHLVRKNFFD